jgi:hypothetical protein
LSLVSFKSIQKFARERYWKNENEEDDDDEAPT